MTRNLAAGRAASSFGKSAAVYERIKRLIIELEFHPGRHVTETEFALLLGVSRTPVRECLGLLLEERWIMEEARSLRIAHMTMRDVRALFRLRLLLETEGVAQAVGQIDKRAQLEELEDLGWGASYDPTDKDSITEFLRRNTEFHARLAAIGGNTWLSSALREVLEQLERATHIALAEGPEVLPDEWVREHQELLGAVAGGSVEEARALAATQVIQAQRRVIEVLLATGAVDAATHSEAADRDA